MIKKTTHSLRVPLLLILIALVVPVRAASYYANSLKDPASLSSDFTNNSGFDGRAVGGAFSSDPIDGLQLTSTGYTEYTGVQTYKNDLSVDQDWIVTVKANLDSLEAFHPDSSAPWSSYNCGLDLAKKGTNSASTSLNRINVLLFDVSPTEIGEPANGIESAIYQNDATLDGNPYSINDLSRGNSTNWLKLQYSSATRSASTFYSLDGISYYSIGSYNLADIWGLQSSDQLVLSLTGSAYQDLGPITNGQISLSNLTIQSAPEPSTYALFGIGAIGMLLVMRRQKTA